MRARRRPVHNPKTENGFVYIAASCGSLLPKRWRRCLLQFRLPITVGRMTAEHGKLRAEIVELSVER
jgi:hypothetical protein